MGMSLPKNMYVRLDCFTVPVSTLCWRLGAARRGESASDQIWRGRSDEHARQFMRWCTDQAVKKVVGRVTHTTAESASDSSRRIRRRCAATGRRSCTLVPCLSHELNPRSDMFVQNCMIRTSMSLSFIISYVATMEHASCCMSMKMGRVYILARLLEVSICRNAYDLRASIFVRCTLSHENPSPLGERQSA